MTKEIYLGKILKNVETKLTKGLSDFKIATKDLGQQILVLGDSPVQNGRLCKVLMEELSKSGEKIVAFDSEGILPSYGLIFPDLQPEDFAKWVLLDSDDDYIDLEAIEASSRFNEMMQLFGITNEELEDLLHDTFFTVITPNSDNGINVSTGIFDVNFSKLKHFAKAIIYSLVSCLYSDDSISTYEEEINFVKLTFEFIKKFKLEVSNYPKTKDFLRELEENVDKFPGSKDVKLKVIETLLKFIKDSAQVLFEGIPLNFKDIFSKQSKKNQVMIFSLVHIEDMFFKNLFIMKAFHQLFNFALDNPEKKISIFLNFPDEILFFKEFLKGISAIKDLKIKNVRLILSSSSYKNLSSLDLSKPSHIFISKIGSEIANNSLSKEFNFSSTLLSEIKEQQFVYIKSGKVVSLLFPRIPYSYHRILESFEIARLLKEDTRNLFEQLYRKLDDIKDKYPELQKKKIGILIIENGPYRGKDVIIDKDEVVIGRYEIYPQNKLISRKHFKIHREGSNFVIIDNSVNGVFINGRRITQATLKERDTIVLGRNEVSLYFEEKEI